MPHTIELKAEARTVAGKKVKQLRRQGYVPGNIYGEGFSSTPIQVEEHALEDALRHATSTTLVELSVAGAPARQVLVRDVQRELLRHTPIHVDFYAVRMDHQIKAQVPLVIHGESPAAKTSDAMLFHPVSQVNVQGRPAALPETIEVDVSGLTEIDQAIHARDLHLPDGVTLLDDPDEIIAKVQMVRGAIEALAEEAAAAAAEGAPAGEQPAARAGEQPSAG